MIPILWSDGTGSDLMKRIAAPMVGGLITSFVLELLIYPVLYEMWRLRELKGEHNALRSAATGLDMTPTISESLYENRAKARKKKPRDKQ